MSPCICYRVSCDGTCGDVHECIRCGESWHDPDGPHKSACPGCDGGSICPTCDEEQLMVCDDCDAVRCREHLHELPLDSPYSHNVSMETFYLCGRCHERYTGRRVA